MNLPARIAERLSREITLIGATSTTRPEGEARILEVETSYGRFEVKVRGRFDRSTQSFSRYNIGVTLDSIGSLRHNIVPSRTVYVTEESIDSSTPTIVKALQKRLEGLKTFASIRQKEADHSEALAKQKEGLLERLRSLYPDTEPVANLQEVYLYSNHGDICIGLAGGDQYTLRLSLNINQPQLDKILDILKDSP